METIEHDCGAPHKAKAYRKAVQALKSHPRAVTNGKEASSLPGVVRQRPS
jgi:hypothetical protein